jgi:uncharacterized protein YcsI (UPF0317 family)
LVILDQSLAEDFALFCERNPAACPLLHRSVPGERRPHALTPDDPLTDVYTDVPRYRVYRHGALIAEVEDVRRYHSERMCAFYVGCSFGFEDALLRAGVPVRNVEQRSNVSMYRTEVRCASAGAISACLVVSMRPVPAALVSRAREVTAALTQCHGAALDCTDPAVLGIADLQRPNFGDPVQLHDGDVPLFWPCGVTTALAAISAVDSPHVVLTHAPGELRERERDVSV